MSGEQGMPYKCVCCGEDIPEDEPIHNVECLADYEPDFANGPNWLCGYACVVKWVIREYGWLLDPVDWDEVGVRPVVDA